MNCPRSPRYLPYEAESPSWMILRSGRAEAIEAEDGLPIPPLDRSQGYRDHPHQVDAVG